MTKQHIVKKHIVTSYRNLSLPLGFTEAMIRVDKPNGDFFYAVPFDTDEVAYLVKIDVKIDDNSQEEEEKDYYDDEIKGADELQDDNSDSNETNDDDVDI